jgi:hypothetical protein
MNGVLIVLVAVGILILISIVRNSYKNSTYIVKNGSDINECNTNNQCPIGKYCINGKCNVKQCVSRIDCNHGEECVMGICEVKRCIYNDDCGINEICKDRVCIPKKLDCRNDNECRGIGYCKMNTCVWLDEGKSCPGDCNMYCVDNICQRNRGSYGQRCIRNHDCERGLICYDGRCNPLNM